MKSSTNLLAKRSYCLGIVTCESLLQGVQCTVQSSRTLVLGVVKSVEFKGQDYFGTLVTKRSCRFGTQESILQVA